MRAVDVIQKKRDGQELTTAEIEWLINGYVAGTVPDYQMSAFAMAIYFKGMTTREISDLTMAMVATGEQIDLSAIAGVKVDKHSTGGVGDKVTLILAPLVASFGIPVAKMSGRGLGHTGGTLDKLESIKGYHIEVEQEQFIQQVQDIGVAVIGQSDKLVKADKLLYALRDVTATVDTIPLIASSVMSKKIAAGADAILLDVTVGEGAFMKTVEEARELATTMVELGKAVGRKTVAVLTDMSQPVGTSIGNRLEILEALDILQGKGREDVTHFICELAQIMLGLANVEKTIDEVRSHLENGQALKKFEEMVQAQGGDLEDLYRSVQVAYEVPVPAEQAGYISALPAMEFGLFAMKLGAGRAVKTDELDYETGIVFHKKVGEAVQVGETVATIYSNEKISENMLTDFQKNVKIEEVVTKTKEIIEIVS
ncbi:pyrimidine-nucleoside phosphorylase [Streptococcus ovis]|uniref:pyrimidine-nucleoside phosphorylase n=1 Tax=Streptococcus ovis TaxID=82806 RepID=UPI00035F6700|nr:pyrimidine-nucleoside phosphorylase [Streptococcus ovis]